MPGYLITPIAEAAAIPIVPSGNITANNLQDAITQLDTNKAQQSALSASVTTLNNNLSASVSALNTDISSVEGVALLGL